MSLRLRLIVAFFALSVLPLGAVTVFTYLSNVKAVQEAAAREADLLAGELTQRMQLVTAQLSERVEHLLSLQTSSMGEVAQVTASTKTPAATRPAASAVAASETTRTPAQAQAAATDAMNAQVATALGEAAMFLNNVDFPGLRRLPPGERQGGSGSGSFGGRGRGDRGSRGAQGPPPGSAGTMPASGAAGTTSTGAAGAVTSTGAAGGATPPVTAGAMPPPATAGSVATSTGTPQRGSGATPRQGPDVGRGGDPNRGQSSRFPPPTGGQPPAGFDPSRGGPAPGGPGGRGGPGTPPSSVVTSETPTGGLRVDIAAMRQQIYQQLVPAGGYEKLTPQERQALSREVNQRLMGIMQGIQLGAEELKKKAADAQRAVDEQTKAAPAVSPAKPVVPKAPAAPAAPPVPPATPAGQGPLKKTSALSGTHIGVSVEQDGKVVQQVNAELNLQGVLETVFSTTRTDRGEVPFAVAKDGTVYGPTEVGKQRIQGLVGLGLVLKPGTPGTLTTIVGDWIVVTTADPSGSGLRFGIARPVGDSMNALRRTAARNASFGLIFIGLAIVGIVPLSGRLTRNLSTLTEGVGRIAHGDFSARVPVRSQDEIGRLAGAFNRMAADVERHQHAAVEQERIRRELELGRQIQHEMLPRVPMHLGLTEVQGVSVPAREVGGDFFNYFEVGDGQIALLVGDVSGKGVGAALLMANIQASLRTRLSLGRDLSAIADAIDHDIEENSPGPVYATLFVGILDPAARRLRYVNAGHHPQYVLRRKGGLDRMASTGLPVGLFAGRGYTERQVQLEPGDVIFFYTDGCVEAENAAGDMFGADKLEALLTSSPVDNPAQVLKRVEAGVTSFRGAVEPFDDETMMAVRVG